MAGSLLASVCQIGIAMHQVIEFYEQNLRLARETGDQRGEITALSSLAHAYNALDKHDKAVECYEQALSIARRIGDARGERQALKSLNEILKPIDGDDKREGSANLPQKPSKKNNKVRTKPTRDKPSRQRTPKQPHTSKKLR